MHSLRLQLLLLKLLVLQMLLQFSGRMVHLQDLRRVKQLISFFMADIQQFLLDMQDFVI